MDTCPNCSIEVDEFGECEDCEQCEDCLDYFSNELISNSLCPNCRIHRIMINPDDPFDEQAEEDRINNGPIYSCSKCGAESHSEIAASNCDCKYDIE
jgi:hypothetical protein